LNIKPQLVTVTVNPEPVLTNSSAAEICSGNALNIALTSNVASGFSWIAADNANTSGETYTGPKQTNVINDVLVNNTSVPQVVTYTITLTSKTGACVNLKPQTIDVTVNKAVAAFTANPLKGEMPLLVQFTNSSTGANHYSWDFDNGTTSTDVNPNYTYTQVGHYQACLVSDDGKCFDKTCISIEVEIHSSFVIPNIFTPNNDGVNDVFTIAGKGIESLHAEIFNRWGQKEYEWDTINGGWDGYSASGGASTPGTYYFMIEIKGMDGKQYSESGSLTLLR
jgi:gliding motility-associated-like protein